MTSSHPQDPKPDPEANIQWPKPYRRLSFDEEKEVLLRQLVAGSKKEPKVLFYLVRLHAANGQREPARHFYERLMRLNPGPQSQFFETAELGRDLMRDKFYSAAVRHFHAALKIVRPEDQQSVCVCAELAECLNALGKHLRAEWYCRRALEVAGTKPGDIFAQLGVALEGQRRYRGAALAYAASEKYGRDAMFRVRYNFSDLLERQPELFLEFGDAAWRISDATDMGARLIHRDSGFKRWWRTTKNRWWHFKFRFNARRAARKKIKERMRLTGQI